MGALEIGVPLERFWRLTPRALSWHHRAARRKAEEDMTRLYAAEALARAKRLPGLDKWLGKRPTPEAPTGRPVVGTARDFFRHLAARRGGAAVATGRPNGAAGHG